MGNFTKDVKNLLVLETTLSAVTQIVFLAFILEAEQSFGAQLAGVVRSIYFVPLAIFAPIMGVYVDRFGPMACLRYSSAALALAFLASAALSGLQIMSGAALALATGVTSAALYLGGCSTGALVKQRVQGSDVAWFNGLAGSIQSSLAIILPVITGLLMTVSGGFRLIMVLGLAIWGANLPLLVERQIQPSGRARESVVKGLKTGLSAFWSNKPLVQLTLVVAVANATEAVFNLQTVVVVKQQTDLTNAGLGILLALQGVGSLLGSLLYAKLNWSARPRWIVWMPIAAVGLVYATFPFSVGQVAVCGILLFLEGLLSMLFVLHAWTDRIHKAEISSIGRVIGISSAGFKILMPPFVFVSGYIASNTSSAVPFLVIGVINTAMYAAVMVRRH